MKETLTAGRMILSGLRQPGPGQHQQVLRNDAAPRILLESVPSRPPAAIQPEDPLQGGDPRLDASAEVPQHLVHPGALPNCSLCRSNSSP